MDSYIVTQTVTFFWYGHTLHFSGPEFLPPKWVAPEKLPDCAGIRPKNRTASKRVGPDVLSGKWVVPANLPGDEGGATQKADIHEITQIVPLYVCMVVFLIFRVQSKFIAPKCELPGARTLSLLLVQISVTLEMGCISTLLGVAVVRLKTRT